MRNFTVNANYAFKIIQYHGVWNITIFNLSNAISRKRCKKIGAKFVLITNRKSHMCFGLVPNSVILDDLERRIALSAA